jgi:hypothetical protein
METEGWIETFVVKFGREKLKDASDFAFRRSDFGRFVVGVI